MLTNNEYTCRSQKRCQKSVRAMDAQSDDLCGASSIIILLPILILLGPVFILCQSVDTFELFYVEDHLTLMAVVALQVGQ